MIQRASKTYGVEPDLIRAVIRAESNFRSESTSPKGAMGLMQIMPATAKDLGIRDAYDPNENIMGGTRYLKGLLDRYGGDVPTALAAYNWGMGNVERRPEKLPRETRDYINRIRNYMDERKS
jgi:soluble lytic murein transglycosylase-like protein